MRNKLAALLKDAGRLYVAQVFGILISFGISVVVARKLGADGRGVYAWVMSLYFIAIQVGQLGTDTLNRRLAASDKAFAPALAGSSALQACVWGSVAAVGLYVFGVMQPVGQAHFGTLALGLAAAPLMVLLGTWNSLAVGLGHAKVLATTELMQRVLLAAFVGVFLLLGHLDVWQLMVALIGGVGLTAAWCGWRVHQLIEKNWRIDLRLMWMERRIIIMAFGAGLCMQLLQKIDLLMLGAWRPLAESGHYSIAQTLIDTMMILPGVLGFLILPHLVGEKDAGQRRHFLLVVLGGVMAGFALCCLAGYILSPYLIPLVFGQEFEATVPVFRRLLLAAVLMAGFQVAQNAVAGTARARYVTVAPVVGVSVKLAFGWVIIPHGMLAAANVTIVAYAAAFATALALALWAAPTATPKAEVKA